MFFLLITARFNPDSSGRSVTHIGKVVLSPSENTRSHPYGGRSSCSCSFCIIKCFRSEFETEV